MDEILHSQGRQALPDAIPAEETAGGARESAREQGRRPLLDALITAGRKVGSVLHRADAAVAGHKAVGPLAFLLAAGVIGTALVVGTVYTPSYVVSVDGTTLGVVTEPEVFEAAMDRVEERASDILGYDYTLDNTVTYDFALTEKDKLSNVGDFETYLFDQIGEVMKSYVLKVNGEFIGAAEDEASLTAMLDAIKAPYINENTTSADFVESVSISRQYTPSDVEQDLSVMQARLTENTNGQTTYEVQSGDTFMQIAYDNDMSMSELEALNPDVDINKIYIGQILNVREVIPFLSVETTETVTYQEAIASPVEEVQDDSMYQGETKVLDPGS